MVLQSLQSQLIGDQAELAKLAEENPGEWVRQNAAFQQRYAHYQNAVQERQALTGRMSADQEAQQLEWRKVEKAALREKLPEWNDPQIAKAEQELVAGYLLEQGYRQDELAELFDHRALIIARDAAKYRQLQAAKAKKAKPEPGTTLRPGAARSNPQSGSELADAIKRAARTGSEDDAMRVLQLKRKHR